MFRELIFGQTNLALSHEWAYDVKEFFERKNKTISVKLIQEKLYNQEQLNEISSKFFSEDTKKFIENMEQQH